MITRMIPEGVSHAVLNTGARSWTDESVMRRTFNQVWRDWGAGSVTRPVLISGQCTSGADAMAERLWRKAGFEVYTFPADWGTHGNYAGFARNEEMVHVASQLRDAGVFVRVTAFLDRCTKKGCRRQQDEQLMPTVPGHFSHGTIHCRAEALDAGLDVFDVMHPDLPPF